MPAWVMFLIGFSLSFLLGLIFPSQKARQERAARRSAEEKETTDAVAYLLARCFPKDLSEVDLSKIPRKVRPYLGTLLDQSLKEKSKVHRVAMRNNEWFFGRASTAQSQRFNVLCSRLQKAELLTSLDLEGNNFDAEVLHRLLQALPGGLQRLMLPGCMLGDSSFNSKQLVGCQLPPQLTHVDLSFNRIKAAQLQEWVLPLLRCCGNLHQLILSGNELGPEGVAHVGKALETLSWPKLRELVLNWASLGDEGLARIVQQIVNFQRALEAQQQQADTAEKAAATTAKTTSSADADADAKPIDPLFRLSVKGNGIGNVGAKLLADNLSCFSVLFLDRNQIDEEGVVQLAAALKDNSSLVELSLWGQDIGERGAQALAEALAHNQTLQMLDLDRTCLTDQGAIALAQALEHNSSVYSLRLSNNAISDAGAQALAHTLQHNQTLRTLLLNGNALGEDGATVLIDALSLNSHLGQLAIDNEALSPAFQDQISALLSQRPHHSPAVALLEKLVDTYRQQELLV